jgi:magnesium chelatase accessory protein
VTEPPAWWPHRELSHFETVGSVRWHVQRWPARESRTNAPQALLLHGTGSASFSWRRLAPILAGHFEVFAPDLPGHGFTLTPSSQSLSMPAVSAALAEWMRARKVVPDLLIGHSAGAALAIRLALDGAVSPSLIVAVNGALLPMGGPIGRMFLPLARLLSTNPLVVPAFAAWASGRSAARRLLTSTGSRIDAEGERCYAHLIADRSHVSGALRLMASWDLAPLQSALHRLTPPLLLLAALGDRTLPPSHAARVHALVPRSRLVNLPALGHLAHEEDANAVACPVMRAWAEAVGPGLGSH